MREIKFRAWSKKDKIMYDVITLDRYYKEKGMALRWAGILRKNPAGPTCQFGVSEEEEKDFILMQYTGLKDKNGKEIYEGDIVRFIKIIGNYISEVKFDKGRFCVKYDIEWIDLYNIQEIEIVGNIYENKELLENRYRVKKQRWYI